jgi:hypothetical protein
MSANKMISQEVHFVKGLDAVADAFAGTVRSDVVSVKNAHAVHFLIHKGVGATGTSVITVNACDDTTPSNRTAIPFKYRACTSGDTWGAMTNATASGFTTTAGSSQLYIVEVDADLLANSGYGYCELTATESVDSPVLGGIIVMLWPLRSPRAVTATQIT